MSLFFFSSRRRHTRCGRDWSSDVCSSDLVEVALMSGAAGEFYNVTWPGFVGALTAMAPGRFAASVNQAPLKRRTSHPRSEERRVGKECRSRWEAHRRREYLICWS